MAGCISGFPSVFTSVDDACKLLEGPAAEGGGPSVMVEEVKKF